MMKWNIEFLISCIHYDCAYAISSFLGCGSWLYRMFLNLQDLTKKPKYLLTITVGYNQRLNVDAMVKKVPSNTCLICFHVLSNGEFLINTAKVSVLTFVIVFWGFPNYTFSLWWSNKWMGWIRVVKKGNSC